MSTDASGIDRWLDRLAGRRRVDAPADEAEEIRRLQQAIERHALGRSGAYARADAAAAAAGIELDEDRAWQAMRTRLRRAGALAPVRRRRTAWPPLAAAAVLLAVGAVAFLRPPGDDDVAVAGRAPPRRFGDLPIIEVTAAEPLPRARRLARALVPCGVRPTVYFHERRATVEFDLEPAQRKAVEGELAAFGILPGALRTGVNRVIFHPL